jgi:hypothetical protein
MKLLTIISASAILTLGNIDLSFAGDSLMYKIIALEKRIMNARKDTFGTYPLLLLEKAKVYKRMSRYEDAAFTLERISTEALPDSVLCLIAYEKALNG